MFRRNGADLDDVIDQRFRSRNGGTFQASRRTSSRWWRTPQTLFCLNPTSVPCEASGAQAQLLPATASRSNVLPHGDCHEAHRTFIFNISALTPHIPLSIFLYLSGKCGRFFCAFISLIRLQVCPALSSLGFSDSLSSYHPVSLSPSQSVPQAFCLTHRVSLSFSPSVSLSSLLCLSLSLHHTPMCWYHRFSDWLVVCFFSARLVFCPWNSKVCRCSGHMTKDDVR